MLGVLREVVAQDRGKGARPVSSAASLLFGPPPPGDADTTYQDLPALRPDTGDPQAGWLAMIENQEPEQRLRALAAPPATSRRSISRRRVPPSN